MEIYICKYCGIEFTSSRKRKGDAFCNHKCFGNYQKTLIGKDSPQYKGKEMIKICPVCKKEFKAKRKEQINCSAECKKKAQKRDVNLVCKMCGKKFIKPISYIKWHDQRGGTNYFCCKKCASTYHVGENSQVWITDRKKIKNINHTIRFSKELITWRIKVFERDDYTCRVCNKRSSKNNKVTLNAHHIYMFSKYPLKRHDINNGITLCECCHKLTYKKEDVYIDTFLELLRRQVDEQISV